MTKGAVGTENQERRSERTAPRRKGWSGTLDHLRRIGTYLWIGLANPAPPTHPKSGRTRASRESSLRCNLRTLRQIRPASVRDRNFICAGITAASKAGQAAQSRQPCVTGRIAHVAETGDTALCV